MTSYRCGFAGCMRLCHGQSWFGFAIIWRSMTWTCNGLQECKALNSRLIDFLKLPDSVAKLLEYITQPAGMESDDKRQFKYPFSSCEVGSAPSAAQDIAATACVNLES